MTALAAHGFSLGSDGDIDQLRNSSAPFRNAPRRSPRTGTGASRNGERLTPAKPGPAAPAWDRRAWAKDRPDKTTPTIGGDLQHRWLTELADLGYRTPTRPVQFAPDPGGDRPRERGRRDRVSAGHAEVGVERRGHPRRGGAGPGPHRFSSTRRSGWRSPKTSPPVPSPRVCPWRPGGVPEHVRALTSARVIEVEADLISQIAARTATPRAVAGVDLDLDQAGLDVGQQAAASGFPCRPCAGGGRGCRRRGEDQLLARSAASSTLQGEDLLVVTPTFKAAQVVRPNRGLTAGSAAWLIHQYGWRWNKHGEWNRLRPGEQDPVSGRHPIAGRRRRRASEGG